MTSIEYIVSSDYFIFVIKLRQKVRRAVWDMRSVEANSILSYYLILQDMGPIIVMNSILSYERETRHLIPDTAHDMKYRMKNW